MWDGQWAALTAGREAVRLDLRGFGESASPPRAVLSPVDDVIHALAELQITRCHLVGASFGAGVAVEVTLARPALVACLLLSAPGGSLIADATQDLRAFAEAERTALADDDLEAAVEANVAWWVDGPYRDAADVDPGVRERVRDMQRRAFEITAGWGDVEEHELDPPALDRLSEVEVPTLVLVGALDLDAVRDAARRVTEGIAHARPVVWPDVAHLPSMERRDDFLQLLRDWLRDAEGTSARS
jgi:pimeloyl-ACP methyl ester carboxylesterase